MVSNGKDTVAQLDTTDRPPVSVASMVENIVGCKWSLRILGLVAGGDRRPSEIQRACPGLSSKVMNERWRKLMRYGIVEREVFGDKPPVRVEYSLTSFGKRFMGILNEIDRLQDELYDLRSEKLEQDD